jgi:uncharacterized protein YfdQ (DUF2303 family)
MFDKEAIQELTKAQAITAAHNSTLSAITGGPGVITLPANFETRDLEKYLKNRRRLRGNMTTSVVKDFASYAEKNAESGAAIFIEPDKMTATAVLNLGTTTEPGHADNLAKLEMKRTAAYEALRRIANEQDKYTQLCQEKNRQRRKEAMRGTLALVLLVEIGNRSPELKKLVDEIFAAIEKTISETPNP